MQIVLQIFEGVIVGVGGVSVVALYFWALGRQHQHKMHQVEREQEQSKVRFRDALTQGVKTGVSNRANVRVIGESISIEHWAHAPVPHSLTYSPHIQSHGTTVSEEKQTQLLLPEPALHIPTFAESLSSGEIGPGQRDMLFCYEILEDEVTRQVSGLSPVRGSIGAQHTQFIVAGSQSGKTTYMAGQVAQAGFLDTLFYVIDPHKNHPEKSISSRIAPFKDFFILPPASTHEEIRRVINHATRVRDLRIQGKATPYDGYHIMVIIDEVPALMAWQRYQSKEIKQLYLSLALFMQSIGTQTAKFGITGLFASQFATKEQLGEIEIRDACMSQFIMRLHPTQAQAMRVLGREVIRDIPKLPKGHGYLMLSDSSEARRVASGNVTGGDLITAATLLPPSPLVKVVQTPGVKVVQSQVKMVDPEDNFPEGESGCESGLKVDGNQLVKVVDDALQAKVEKVLGMLGQNKGEVIYAVWGEKPSKGDRYTQALAEYDQVMGIIRDMARKKIGA